MQLKQGVSPVCKCSNSVLQHVRY